MYRLTAVVPTYSRGLRAEEVTELKEEELWAHTDEYTLAIAQEAEDPDGKTGNLTQ